MHIVAIGGSDAGISAALRAREVNPDAEFTVMVADAYPNYSICGIPYYVSGEVDHRTCDATAALPRRSRSRRTKSAAWRHNGSQAEQRRPESRR
jgi:hypothetical protein